MGITRRTFIKGLGSGITAVGLADVVLTRSGWAGVVAPAKTKGTQVTTSICPFCGVGCGLIANTKGGKLINVEGDPDHPINQGTLCSKGQAVFEVVTSPRRLQKVRYRAPGSRPLGREAPGVGHHHPGPAGQGHPGQGVHHQEPCRGDGQPHRSPGLHRRGGDQQRRMLPGRQTHPGPGHRLFRASSPALTLVHRGLVGANFRTRRHDQPLERYRQQ